MLEALGETLQNICLGNNATKSKDCKSLTNKATTTSYSVKGRRMIQFTFLKAAKEDGLLTPDAIIY